MLSAVPNEQEGEQQSAPLLELPEPLVLAVTQCLAAAGDQRSLFSAARAHSRLRQAAVAALSSIAKVVDEQQADGVLGKHGQHVNGVALTGRLWTNPIVRQLPPSLRLHSLELRWLKVQLLPGGGRRGALGYAGVAALKQLRLERCMLLDDPASEDKLVAALAQLAPGLEHLSITATSYDRFYHSLTVPMGVLQQGLQQLTHLDLGGVSVLGSDPHSPAQQHPLQGWSRLADLRLVAEEGCYESLVVTASMLSGTTGLTRLELVGWLEPAALAGMPQLQHLQLCVSEDAATWTAQLLLQLEALQQLTYLSFPRVQPATPSAAYSALTASSRLQHLNLNNCTLPAGVWQHVFPAGRQLPHLTALHAAHVREPVDDPFLEDGAFIAAPEGSRLVSCCPGLRHLDVRNLTYSAGTFSPLQGLTGLHTLLASVPDTGEAMWEVCQLTGLRDLNVSVPRGADGLLLQVSSLRHLTKLVYCRPHPQPLQGGTDSLLVIQKDPNGEPVWRQVLRQHLDHSDPAVAEQAAAALAVAS